MRSTRTKQRHTNHMKGDRAAKIVEGKLPEEWVSRTIYPDYGLDLHIEVFEPSPEDPTSANTLGEHLYIQVKSSEDVKHSQLVVRSRRNVTKAIADKQSGTPIEIDVVRVRVDTAALLTIEAMGDAVPVLLCYVDLTTEDVYYVCLNDYIAKSLLPDNGNYEQQGSVTLYLPAWNVLDRNDPSFSYLRLLSRRSRFYAAFNLFSYQSKELDAALSSFLAFDLVYQGTEIPLPPDLLTMADTFLRSALRLEIWAPVGDAYWGPLNDVHGDFLSLSASFPRDREPKVNEDLQAWLWSLHSAFSRAAGLGNTYEETVREWRQPTYIAALLDYDPHQAHNPPAPASTLGSPATV